MCRNPRYRNVSSAFYYPVGYNIGKPRQKHSKSAHYVRATLLCLLCLGLSGFYGCCFAQASASNRLVHYDGSNGLDQSSVKNAAVDAWGFLWLSTQSGLVRFDGRRFRSFNSSDIPGLSNDRFANIGVSAEGQIWAHTVNNQFVTVYQPAPHMTPVPRVVTNKVMIIPVAGFAMENSAEITRLAEDREKGDKGLPVIACTRSKELYMIYQNRLYCIRQGQMTLIDTIPEAPPGQPRNLSFTVVNDDVYILVFGGNHVKAWQHGKLLPGITRLEGDVLKDSVAFPYNGYSVLWTKSSALLYAGHHIYRVVFKNGRIVTERVVSNIDVGPGLSAIHYLDREKKYVACIRGENGGISVISPDLFRYPALPADIRSHSFFSQARTGPAELYARNYLFSQNGNHRGLPTGSDQNDDFRTTYISSGGDLYFENNQHLFKYNVHTRAQNSLMPVDGVLKAILPDKYSNDILFCTQFSINRLTADRLAGSWKIPGRSAATTFLQIDRDRLLIGTENGLKWFQTSNSKVERSMLDSASIWSLYKEANGNIWISTYGKGFYLFDGQKLTTFPLGPRKALKTVHSFIDDGRGNFWLPTNDGLFSVSKKELLSYAKGSTDDVCFFRFDKGDGLTNNEFNGGSKPSHVWLADSMLSIPAIDGLVWFYPHRVTLVYPQNPVLVEALLVNGHPAPTDSLAQLPAGSHTVQLQVGTAYFGNSENLRLEYQVNGYSDRWEVLPQDGKVLLQNFPAGKYKLIFRKRKNQDPSQYDQLQIPFRIAPFFYNTIWFYMLVGLALLAVAYFFVRWRTRSLELEAKRLEQKVEERTSVLNNMVVQLEHSQNQLRESDEIKDRLVSMVLHDLRSPIRFLEMMGTRLVLNHRDLDRDILTERIVEIGNSASSLYSYVNQFLTWTSTQHGLYTVRRQWVALAPLFAGITELYAEIARYHQNTLTLDHGDIHCDTDPDLLMAILRNLVDNAMKYTHDGSISVKAEMDGNDAKITVADTGAGMTPAQIAVFYGNGSQEAYAGLGSTLVRDLLQKLEGRLAIESQPGIGTAITVHLTGNHLPSHKNGQGS